MIFTPRHNGWVHLQAFALVAMVFLSTAILATFFFFHNRAVSEQQLRTTLENYAALSAMQFDPDEILALQNADDMGTAEFHHVTETLYFIRQKVSNVRYAYIMRRTEDPMTLEFVSDADLYLFPQGEDQNNDGVLTGVEQPSATGIPYDISDVPALQGPAFEHVASDKDFTEDQWGRVLSAYAPIFDHSGKVIAVLGLDMGADDFLKLSLSLFRPTVFILIILLGLFVATYATVLIWQRRVAFIRELEEERSALINLALHQLGAPIAIFRWWLEILKDKDECKRDEKSMEICKEMNEGVERMTAIITALREVSALENATLPRVKEPVDVQSVLTTLAEEFSSRLAHQHIKLSERIDADIKPVMMDKKLLVAVMREFIGNAIDYSPQHTQITVRASSHKNTVQIKIQDQGYGIPAADLPRMFQKFSRGSNASKYKPAGNGIGLFFAKKAVERVGGKVWVDSEEGRGTIFTFTVPVK